MLTSQIRVAVAASLCLLLIGCGSPSSSPSSSQTTPVATVSPTASTVPTSTAGRGRKSASTAVLPAKVAGWMSIGEVVNLATSSTANYTSTSKSITGQALAVVLRRPDADASLMGHAIPGAKPYDKAICGDIGKALGHTCYVQLLGGVMNVTTSKGVTLAQTASLANLLYAALRG